MKESKRMERVLKKSKTRILVIEVSQNVQGGRRGCHRRSQHGGVEMETRAKGEDAGECQGGCVQSLSS
jgi:hypothetical protein